MSTRWYFCRVSQIGLEAKRNRPKADPGAVFVEIVGIDERAYGRIKSFDAPISLGDCILCQIVEDDGYRVRQGTGTKVFKNFKIGDLHDQVTEALSDPSLGIKDVRWILSHVNSTSIHEWWESVHDKFPLRRNALTAIAECVSAIDQSDLTFGLRQSDDIDAGMINSWANERRELVLKIRHVNGWNIPNLDELTSEVLRILMQSPFSAEVQADASQLLLGRLSYEEILDLSSGKGSSTVLENALVVWASTRSIPSDHRLFVYSDHSSFIEATHLMEDLQGLAFLRQRVSMGLLEPSQLPRAIQWKLAARPSPWSSSFEKTHIFISLAAEFATDDDFADVLNGVRQLNVDPVANTRDSSLAIAIETLASRFFMHPDAPGWFGSFPSPERGWDQMSAQQQMFLILREHVQGTASTIAQARGSLENVVKVLLYLCEYAEGAWNRDGIYDNLVKALSIIGDYSDSLIENGEVLNLTPLLPGCEVDDLRVRSINHCEGRFAVEGSKIDGLNVWTRVQPEHCRCPRTRQECRVDNGLEPRLDKVWWRWSMNEVLAECKIDYQQLARKFNIENHDGDLFVTRLGGVANRVAELQDILKCRGCGRYLRFQMKYSVNPAYYMATTTHACEAGLDGCDGAVYASHCKGCGRFIDSRDSRIQDMPPEVPGKPYRGRGYYICIHCGTGSSKDEAGRICPQCGARHSMGGVGRHRTCRNCGHEIDLPGGRY